MEPRVSIFRLFVMKEGRTAPQAPSSPSCGAGLIQDAQGSGNTV